MQVFNQEEELVHSAEVDFENSELDLMGCNPTEVSRVKISNLTGNFARLAFSEIVFFKEDKSKLNEYEIPAEGVESFLKVNSGFEVNADGRLAVVNNNNIITSWDAENSEQLKDVYHDDQSTVSREAKAAFYSKDLTGFLASSDFLEADYIDEEIQQMKRIATLSSGKQIPLTEKIDAKLVEYLSSEEKPEVPQISSIELAKEIAKSGGVLELLYRYACVPHFFGDEFVDIVPDVSVQKPKYASLDFPSDLSFSDGFTLECWIKHGHRGPLIHKGGGGSDDGFCLMLYNGNYRFELQNTETQEKAILDVPLTDGRVWNHVALTWDAISKEMSIYVNGSKRSQTLLFEGPIGVNNDIPLMLGRWASRPHMRSLNAAFSELRIWSACRNEKDIKENFQKRIEESHSDLVFRRSFSKDLNHSEIRNQSDHYANVDWLLSDSLPFAPTKFLSLGNSEVTLEQLNYSLTAMGGLELRRGKYNDAIALFEKAKYSGIDLHASQISPALLGEGRLNLISRFLLGLAYLKADRLDEADEIVSGDMLVQGDWENRNLRNNGNLRRSLNLHIIGALREEYARERSRMQL